MRDVCMCMLGNGFVMCGQLIFGRAVGASELETSTAATMTAVDTVLVAAPHLRLNHQDSPLQPTTTVMVVREEGADDNFKELIEGIFTFFHKA